MDMSSPFLASYRLQNYLSPVTTCDKVLCLDRELLIAFTGVNKPAMKLILNRFTLLEIEFAFFVGSLNNQTLKI